MIYLGFPFDNGIIVHWSFATLLKSLRKVVGPIEENFATIGSYETGPDILKISRRLLSNALPHGFRVVLEVYTSTKTSEPNIDNQMELAQWGAPSGPQLEIWNHVRDGITTVDATHEIYTKFHSLF